MSIHSLRHKISEGTFEVVRIGRRVMLDIKHLDSFIEANTVKYDWWSGSEMKEKRIERNG